MADRHYRLTSTSRDLFNVGVALITLSFTALAFAVLMLTQGYWVFGALILFIGPAANVLGVLFLNGYAEKQREERFAAAMSQVAQELKDGG